MMAENMKGRASPRFNISIRPSTSPNDADEPFVTPQAKDKEKAKGTESPSFGSRENAVSAMTGQPQQPRMLSPRNTFRYTSDIVRQTCNGPSTNYFNQVFFGQPGNYNVRLHISGDPPQAITVIGGSSSFSSSSTQSSRDQSHPTPSSPHF